VQSGCLTQESLALSAKGRSVDFDDFILAKVAGISKCLIQPLGGQVFDVCGDLHVLTLEFVEAKGEAKVSCW
jgi:hypothetical protein